MLMQYVDDYNRMFRSMLTRDNRVGIINIHCINKRSLLDIPVRCSVIHATK